MTWFDANFQKNFLIAIKVIEDIEEIDVTSDKEEDAVVIDIEEVVVVMEEMIAFIE